MPAALFTISDVHLLAALWSWTLYFVVAFVVCIENVFLEPFSYSSELNWPLFGNWRNNLKFHLIWYLCKLTIFRDNSSNESSIVRFVSNPKKTSVIFINNWNWVYVIWWNYICSFKIRVRSWMSGTHVNICCPFQPLSSLTSRDFAKNLKWFVLTNSLDSIYWRLFIRASKAKTFLTNFSFSCFDALNSSLI